MKGGVGKTTLCVNIGYALSYFHQKKVLLIDNDPQFNTTQYLMPMQRYLHHIDSGGLTILDIFKTRPETAPNLATSGEQQINSPELTLENIVLNIFEKDDGKLDLIPSTLRLMEIEYSERGTEYLLKNFIDTKARNVYDYILIDCPPTLTIYTLSAYLASDALLIPIKTDHLSSVGISLLEWGLEQYHRKYGKELSNLGIIFTMIDLRGKKPPLSEVIMQRIRESGRPSFTNYLKFSTNIAKAVTENSPLFLYPPTRYEHGKAVKQITNEFLVRLGEV